MPGGGAKPGERRGGRQKGVPNKVTSELKDMVLQALEKAGGVEYLAKQAKQCPAAFMTLLGRVLPLQVSGVNGSPIQVTISKDDASL